MKNIFQKSKEERKASLMRGIQVGLIPNTSPDYTAAITATQTAEPELRTVTLLELRPFDNNPRKTQNPKFEEIKESIRVRGLDFPPNITKRPNENFYIIADGGNTRLQALKELYEETQDPKYFSIRCLYKPWQGESDDNTEGDLHCLIGHLAENDLRGDLTFIERALGIAQAKQFYEKQLGESLSHRKFIERLKADGYSVTYSVWARMQQCIDLLYPAIPTLLFNGMGRPQIEKLLIIYNNAEKCFDKYTALHYKDNNSFQSLWLDTLKRFDNDDYSFEIFQDELIGNMVNEIGTDYVSYQDILFELENKPKANVSTNQETEAVNENITPSQELKTEPDNQNNEKSEDAQKISTDRSVTSEQKTNDFDGFGHSEPENEDYQTEPDDEESLTTEPDNNIDDNGLSDFGLSFEKQQSINEQKQQRATQNGIAFANSGCQPVEDIWQIYPAIDNVEKLRFEAYGLTTDIVSIIGLKSSIIEPINDDFSFTILPLSQSDNVSALQENIHQLLACLATDGHDENLTCTLNESLLIGMESEPEINDLLLVKIFRLIRVMRQLRQHLRGC